MSVGASIGDEVAGGDAVAVGTIGVLVAVGGIAVCIAVCVGTGVFDGAGVGVAA